MSTECFLGIDVGTASARAGVFDAAGTLLAAAASGIPLHRNGQAVEQSSAEIWTAVVDAVRSAVAEAGVQDEDVRGIGFDAACSLVVVGPGGEPLAVGDAGDGSRDVIVWMDHRATDQAARINRTGADVLRYVGGTMSPEMQLPKVLWLAEHSPTTFRQAWLFMDLVDYLTWRATGSLARSTCTVTCKWTYLPHEDRFDPSFFRAIGLGSIADEGFARIGSDIVPGGTPLASGLSSPAAAELGLAAGTPVAAGLIDAHAGGIGTIGAPGGPGGVMTRMAYVFGTSACTMTSTVDPTFVPGVWGPYLTAMVPGLWLNEGGQSAAGAALDRLVELHPMHAAVADLAAAQGTTPIAWLAEQAEARGGAAAVAALVGAVHVVPEFLGNRAPFADPDALAVIAGLGMDASIESLIGQYVAGLCGVGYGAKQIIRALRDSGVPVEAIVVSGGAARSPLTRQLLADATGLPVAVPATTEPVLLGAAMLGTVAAGRHPTIEAAMTAMSRIAGAHQPDPTTSGWHQSRFAAFETLQRAARTVRDLTRAG